MEVSQLPFGRGAGLIFMDEISRGGMLLSSRAFRLSHNFLFRRQPREQKRMALMKDNNSKSILFKEDKAKARIMRVALSLIIEHKVSRF